MLQIFIFVFFDRDGFAVVISLDYIAPEVPQLIDLGLFLGTLGKAYKTQFLGKRDDMPDNGEVLFLYVFAHFVNEALIYLKSIERHLREERE